MTRLLLAFLLFTMGCSPLRHYKKVATDTEVTPKKKKIMAPWIMANFPSEDRYVPGDTLVRIDTLDRADTIYWETVDTLRIQEPTVTRYITRTITIRDTIYRNDPKTKAELFTLRDNLAKAEYRQTAQAEEIADLKIEIGLKQDQVAKLWWWLIGVGVVFGAFVVLSIKKKIPFI